MSRNLFHDAIHALDDDAFGKIITAARARALEVCNCCDDVIAHPNPGGYCDACLAECEPGELTAEEEYEAALEGLADETPEDAAMIAALADRRYWMRTRSSK